jgi:hypothetical protein
VIEADIERRRKRDDLLDGQLRELSEREQSIQRQQADAIDLPADPQRGLSAVPGERPTGKTDAIR